jgi:hypothetical protein
MYIVTLRVLSARGGHHAALQNKEIWHAYTTLHFQGAVRGHRERSTRLRAVSDGRSVPRDQAVSLVRPLPSTQRPALIAR